MKIHDGDLHDLTRKKSDLFLTVNSCGVGQVTDYPLLTLRRNGREDYHIVYVAAGELLVRHGESENLLYAGDFFVYFPKEPQWYRASEGSTTLWMHFDGRAVPELLEGAALSSSVYRAAPDGRVRRLFSSMMTEHHLAGNGYISGAVGYLTALIAQLGNLAAQHGQIPDARLRTVLAYLNEHYAEETSCAALAQMALLSRSHFLTLFREAVGLSPLAYRTALRVRHARELLTSSPLTIAEISRAVGYDDPLYFSRVFRKSTGLSPEAFRKRLDKS